VLPTLLSKVATLPSNKQRMLLAVVSALEALPPNAPAPEWVANLNKPAEVTPAVVASDTQPSSQRPHSSTKEENVPESKAESETVVKKNDADGSLPRPSLVSETAAAPVLPPGPVRESLHENRILLRIFSTYGTGTSVGLTEVRPMCLCFRIHALILVGLLPPGLLPSWSSWMNARIVLKFEVTTSW
jgi:hypothetical protein